MSVFIADRRNSFPSPLISNVNYFFLLATLFLNRWLSIPILWSCELYLVAYPTHFQSPYITHYVKNPYFSIYQSTWSTILVALPFQPLSVSSTHLRLCLRSIHISTRCGGLSRPWSPETASPWLADTFWAHSWAVHVLVVTGWQFSGRAWTGPKTNAASLWSWRCPFSPKKVELY